MSFCSFREIARDRYCFQGDAHTKLGALGVMKALKVSAPLVDARGRPCPWPIIELARALKLHPEVELWADDRAARADLDSYCAATKARVVAIEVSGPVLQAVVARG